MSKKPFELKTREDSLEGYRDTEITVTKLTIDVPDQLYDKLVETVRGDMVDSAMASIEWYLDDPEPVLDVSFKHLESVRFKLEPLLQEIADNISSTHARDTLALMLEKTAANLREIDDEYFEQF